MAVWLIRAGEHGEYEDKFIREKRVYVTWEYLSEDLKKLASRSDLTALLTKKYPDDKPNTIRNWVGQVWPFAHDMQKGDLVILPIKSQRTIYVGEITGDYINEIKGPAPFYHWRSVKWIGESIPRSNFGQDLLYSFGAFKTICRIQRNNAESRIAAMRANGWKPETISSVAKMPSVASDSDEIITVPDLEELARDQILPELLKPSSRGMV